MTKNLIVLYCRTTGIAGYGYGFASPSHSTRIFDWDAYSAWLDAQT